MIRRTHMEQTTEGRFIVGDTGRSSGCAHHPGVWCLPCLVAVGSICVSALPARAQLSNDDIANLRARGTLEGWTFTVGKNPATTRSLDELCGLVEPKDWRAKALFDPSTPSRGLPASFNWCNQGACTPVRAQGGCGSCWAFATVGPLESNILIVDGLNVDLSEQWLINCNQDGWD